MVASKIKAPSPVVIDLTEDIDPTSKTLFSNHLGKALAEKYDLLTVVAGSAQPVEIVIPHQIYAITSAFFMGMFGEAMEALGGPEPFRQRVSFIYENESIKGFIATNIEEVWGRLHPQTSSTYETSDFEL